MLNRYRDSRPYVTKDGSTIRELMHPQLHGNANQSLAEATIPIGTITHLHLHRVSEEIYHVVGGHGLMQLGDEEFAIAPGDTVLIRPGTAHAVCNTGEEPLRLLCSCAPPYSHDDTYLLDGRR